MKRVDFDKVADEYDETRSLPEDAMKRVLAALCEEMSGGKSVLDIGSGTGRFALPLSKKGFHVIGIDISKKMIQISGSKGFSRCVTGDASFLPFKNRSFDFALANHILHLLEDWKNAVSEIKRVVRASLLAVIIEKESGWFKDGYDDLLQKRGYETREPGVGAKGLSERIPPKAIRHSASVTITQSADVLLDRLERRCFSTQWEVPEDIHHEAVAAMRARYGGKKLENSYDLFIYVWDTADLDVGALVG
ncbi:MAG: class I SAM-dependent methyltransferase [Thermoplasmata archaeon]